MNKMKIRVKVASKTQALVAAEDQQQEEGQEGELGGGGAHSKSKRKKKKNKKVLITRCTTKCFGEYPILPGRGGRPLVPGELVSESDARQHHGLECGAQRSLTWSDVPHATDAVFAHEAYKNGVGVIRLGLGSVAKVSGKWVIENESDLWLGPSGAAPRVAGQTAADLSRADKNAANASVPTREDPSSPLNKSLRGLAERGTPFALYTAINLGTNKDPSTEGKVRFLGLFTITMVVCKAEKPEVVSKAYSDLVKYLAEVDSQTPVGGDDARYIRFREAYHSKYYLEQYVPSNIYSEEESAPPRSTAPHWETRRTKLLLHSKQENWVTRLAVGIVFWFLRIQQIG